MEKINVILLDDHNIVRDGIRSILVSEDDINVIGEASSYMELKELLGKIKPDIIIADISLGDISGIDIVAEINKDYQDIKTIMLTMYTDEDFILNSIKAGAKGYLPKNTSKKELVEAIRNVKSGREYFSENIKEIMLKSYLKQVHEDDRQPVPNRLLTRREEEILKLCAKGLSNKSISEMLFISARTVESHKNHIMSKLDLKTNTEMVLYAIKNKIIDL